MGIQNRDYYRDSTARTPGWISGAPACQWLIITTCVTFVLQLVFTQPGRGESLIDEWFAVDPDAVLHGQVWRIVTYAFLHSRGDLWHILFNMLALWWFGRAIEQLYGSREFVWFYLVSAALGGLGFTAWGVFMNDPVGAVGASGAVMAVFMLFARHYPHEKVYIFGLIAIEAQWLVWIYVVVDLHPVLMAISSGQHMGRVAHVVHLSGLAFGWAYYQYHWRLSSGWSRLAGNLSLRWRRNTSGRKLKVYQPQMEEEPVDLEVELDRILAKIHDHGSESLTDRERSLLTRASERYKRKG